YTAGFLKWVGQAIVRERATLSKSAQAILDKAGGCVRAAPKSPSLKANPRRFVPYQLTFVFLETLRHAPTRSWCVCYVFLFWRLKTSPWLQGFQGQTGRPHRQG